MKTFYKFGQTPKLIRFALVAILLFFVHDNLALAQNAMSSNASKNILETLDVDITTHLGDDQVFNEGDKISFFVNISQTAYLTMLYKDATGRVLQIIPNQKDKKSLYQAGMFIKVPKDSATFEFVVQPAFGKEQAWVYATDKPLVELPGINLGNGLRLLDGDIDSLAAMISANAKELGLKESHAFVDLTTQSHGM